MNTNISSPPAPIPATPTYAIIRAFTLIHIYLNASQSSPTSNQAASNEPGQGEDKTAGTHSQKADKTSCALEGEVYKS